MHIRTMTVEMWVPRPIAEVFALFGDAGNLEQLTPPSLGLRVLTPRPINLRAGTIIDYRLRLGLLPLHWRSEITVWEPPHRFVDTQLRGPYRHWVHKHSFEDR
jgi:ligand-binding SRPBCC domain-containing protein